MSAKTLNRLHNRLVKPALGTPPGAPHARARRRPAGGQRGAGGGAASWAVAYASDPCPGASDTRDFSTAPGDNSAADQRNCCPAKPLNTVPLAAAAAAAVRPCMARPPDLPGGDGGEERSVPPATTRDDGVVAPRRGVTGTTAWRHGATLMTPARRRHGRAGPPRAARRPP